MDSVRPLHLNWVSNDNKAAETSWRNKLKKRNHHKIKVIQKVTPTACIDPVEQRPRYGRLQCCGIRDWADRRQKPVLSFNLKFTEGSRLLLKLSRLVFFFFILVCHVFFTRDTMAAAWMVRTDSQQVLASFQCSFIVHSHMGMSSPQHQTVHLSHDPRIPLLPGFRIVFPMVSRSGISDGSEEALLSIYPACKQSQDAGTVCPTTDALTLNLLPEKKVLQISCATSAKSRSAYKKQC